MIFMYVDESGDSGVYNGNNSKHFILTGFIIHSDKWKSHLNEMVDIKRFLKSKYGLNVREEVHGSEIINPRGSSAYRDIGNRAKRVNLYRDFLKEVTKRIPDAMVVNVMCDKTAPSVPADIEEYCWLLLIQRFENSLTRNFKNSKGVIFADQTNEKKVRKLLRKMRHINHIPSQYSTSALQNPVSNIVEDPVMRESDESYFIQISDAISHALYRKAFPTKGYQRYNVERLFDLVDPILNKKASGKDPWKQGVVRT